MMNRISNRGCQQAPSPLEAALDYYKRDWSIIPIAVGTKKPPKGFKWTKHQNTRPTEGELRDWFAERDDLGVAVILGDVSGGLVCRDFDIQEAYDRWAADHPDLAKSLPTVATARGRHVYFRANHRRIKKLADGELRGGGYCLLPPSRHPNGPIYRWLIPLPDGNLPLVENIRAADFLSDCANVTESTETTERTETTEDNRREQRQCRRDSLEKTIETAIIESLPTRIGKRNRQVFELARALKGIPALADATAENLESYVRAWHTIGLQRGVVGTEPFDETRIDFLLAWPKVKFPKGAEPMTKLFEAAKRNPLPQSAMRYQGDGLRLLVALCRHLQRQAGGDPFFLACRTAGGLLGVEHVTAWRWLFALVHDGVLVEVEKGSAKRRRASRYRYLGD